MTSILRTLYTDRLYLIALSGGADSIALALMMKEQRLNVLALHCNFRLRGEESDRDEQFVRDFCHKHAIPLEVCHFDTLASAREHKTSIEMEARDLRYRWFAQRAQALDAEAICVAHHKDDQAETLLLNLIRGTGLKGLAAMHPNRIVNGLRIIRPLLDITKKEILQYLARMGQDYVTDSSNLERDALRNRIRLDLMPMLRQLNPNITDCLARTAHNVRLELDSNSEESHYYRWLAPLGFSRSQILDIYAHCSNGLAELDERRRIKVKTENGKLRVSENRSTVGTLRAASENDKESGRCTQSHNVAMEIATLTRHRLTSQSIFQGPRSPYITELEQIQDDKVELKPSAHPSPLTANNCPPETGGRAQSAEGVDKTPFTPHPSPFTAHRSSGLTWHSATHTLLLDRGELILQEKGTSANTTLQLHIEELPTGIVPSTHDFLNKAQAFIDADSIKGEPVLRPMRQGDRFRPYGMKHGTKLLSDFLTDRKVSILDKQTQLVAVDSSTDAIIWIVGREIDHRYRISPTTKRILRLTCGE